MKFRPKNWPPGCSLLFPFAFFESCLFASPYDFDSHLGAARAVPREWYLAFLPLGNWRLTHTVSLAQGILQDRTWENSCRCLWDACLEIQVQIHEQSTLIISITLFWNLSHSEIAFMPFVLMVFARSRIIFWSKWFTTRVCRTLQCRQEGSLLVT